MKLYKMLLLFLATALTMAAAAGKKVDLDASEPDDMSAYYAAKAQSVEVLKKKFIERGFEVLDQSEPVKGQYVLSITNPQLKKTNSWMAVLNLVTNEKETRIQNPSYFGAAYLKGYKYGDFKKTLIAIESILGDLYTTKEEYEFDELKDYHFTFGMPYVDDTIEVGEGKGLKSKLGPNRGVSYVLDLPNGSTLVGHKLSDNVNGFLKTLGQEHNAQILPYKSMIKDGEATMLNPKYYLAVSLPLLSMGGFMKISDIPGKIEEEIKKTYK